MHVRVLPFQNVDSSLPRPRMFLSEDATLLSGVMYIPLSGTLYYPMLLKVLNNTLFIYIDFVLFVYVSFSPNTNVEIEIHNLSMRKTIGCVNYKLVHTLNHILDRDQTTISTN